MSPPETEPASAGPARTGPADPGQPDERPLRVTTLELFFDLVFAFTLTQLATLPPADSPRRTRGGCC